VNSTFALNKAVIAELSRARLYFINHTYNLVQWNLSSAFNPSQE